MIVAVIRHVVLFELDPNHDPAELREVIAGLRNLNLPGTISYTIGEDLGLLRGSWSLAIVADFTDADAYRDYNEDPEHDRLRTRLAAMTAQAARVQFVC